MCHSATLEQKGPLSKELAFHSQKKMEKNKQQQDETSKHNICIPPPLCRAQSLPGQVLPGNKGKHWVGGGQETKDNIGLVVVLLANAIAHSIAQTLFMQPRGPEAPVVLSCQVQSCQETKENIGLVVVRKQRKTLGWWWSYLILYGIPLPKHFASQSRIASKRLKTLGFEIFRG